MYVCIMYVYYNYDLLGLCTYVLDYDMTIIDDV